MLGLEAVAVSALFLRGADDSFHQAVLLRGDELLPRTATAHQPGALPASTPNPCPISKKGAATRPKLP